MMYEKSDKRPLKRGVYPFMDHLKDLSFSIKSNGPIKVPIIKSIISLNLFDYKDVTVQQLVVVKNK